VFYTILSLASGLEVNFCKSKLGGVGIPPAELHRYAALFNSTVMELPFIYLGILVGVNPRRVETWSPMINKVSPCGSNVTFTLEGTSV